MREDGVPLNALYQMPLPDDHVAWNAMKAAVGAHYDQAARALADTRRSHVETIAMGDAVIHVAGPETPAHPGCAMIDLHAGALVFGGGDACREAAQMQADRHGIPCYGVDYRMPPQLP